MKVLAISDTHGFHWLVDVPANVDMIIHAGDASNTKDTLTNHKEMYDFYKWFAAINVKYKIFIPGNHDTSIEHGLFRMPNDVIMLDHRNIVIEGISIFGSPYTPEFGVGWAYNRKREKINKYWEQIPDCTDILVTHGPPKSILDLTEDRDYKLEQVGDSALMKRVQKIQPAYHIFGHVHDFKNCLNHGTRRIDQTTFINASMVEDGRFDYGLIHQGITFEI